jgi:hypothetical protein
VERIEGKYAPTPAASSFYAIFFRSGCQTTGDQPVRETPRESGHGGEDGNTDAARKLLAEHGVQLARTISPDSGGSNKQARELKQSVSETSNTWRTGSCRRRACACSASRTNAINKLHKEGLNNAINSTTVAWPC